MGTFCDCSCAVNGLKNICRVNLRSLGFKTRFRSVLAARFQIVPSSREMFFVASRSEEISPSYTDIHIAHSTIAHTTSNVVHWDIVSHAFVLQQDKMKCLTPMMSC